MHKLPLILRTLRYVKPIQIWNRIWRKRLSLFIRNHKLETVNGKLQTLNSSPLPEFTFLNTTARPEGWNDRRMEKLWLYNLHYFDYLDRGRWRKEVGVDSGIVPSSLVCRWIDENPVGRGNGWEPYPISLRVVNWVKFLVYGLKFEVDGEKELKLGVEVEERIRLSLVQQVRWLEKRLEYHLLANHLLANAKALVFAGAYFGGHAGCVTLPDARRWLEKGMAIYRRELPEQTCADGVHFELSPMYHAIILEDILDCLWLMRGRKEVEVEKGVEVEKEVEVDNGVKLFSEYAGRMLAGLKILIGPDGKIAKFNDSTEGIARSPAYLFDYAKKLGIEVSAPTLNPQPSTLNSSGFVRKEAGNYTLLAKCGAIGPSYQPGHAHADTFSFELWRGSAKIVGDTGCSTYVPGATRSYERSTAAHNTVVIDGENSSEVWAAHRVGRRFDFGKHRRRFELAEDGLKGTDEIFGRGEHDVEVRFHLPPGVAEQDVAIACAGERRVETCRFAAGWNRREEGICVIYRQQLTLPATIEWSVR